MTILRYIRNIIASAAAAAMMTACGDDPVQDTFVYTDVVILADNGPDTGSVYLLADNTLVAPCVTLDPEQFPTGECMLLRYTIDGISAFGQTLITPSGVAHINNLEVTVADSEPRFEDSEPVSLVTAWLNRTHLVVRCMLPYDPNPRSIGITAVCDDGSDRVDLYLVHHRDEPTVTFSREYYIAADLTQFAAATPTPIGLHLPGVDTTVGLTLAPL